MLFAGQRFFLWHTLPFGTAAELREALPKHGGSVTNLREEAHFLVFDSFLGDEFAEQYKQSEAKGLKCHAIGVRLIRDSISQGKSLPERDQLPVFSRVLEGVHFTCSGLEDSERTQMYTLGSFMLAESTRELVSGVTHVIARFSPGSPPSTKLQAALDRGMKVVSPNWILKCWKSGTKVDESPFSISFTPTPPLKGLRLSMTGIESMEARVSISAMIKDLGGESRSDLSEECTHLICDPMRTRTSEDSKYHYAKIWKISIVSLAWLKACAKSRTRVDEATYPVNPTSSSPQEPSPANVVPIKEEPLIPPPNPPMTFLAGCVIFCYGFGADVRQVQHEVRQAGGQLIFKFHRDTTHIIVAPDVPPSAVESLLKQFDSKPYAVSAAWLVDSLERNQNLPPTDYIVYDTNPVSQRKRANQNPGKGSPSKRRAVEEIKSTLFEQSTFLLLGIPSPLIPEVKSVIVSHSGSVLLQEDLEAFVSNRSRLPAIRGVITLHGVDVLDSFREIFRAILPQIPFVATTQWLERSILAQNLLDPESSIIYRPLPFKSSYYKTFMSDVVVTLSGFEREVKDELAALVALLGATYSAALKIKLTTHLICTAPNGEKFDKAKSEGTIKLVSRQWLEECALKGFKAQEKNFPVMDPTPLPPPQPTSNLPAPIFMTSNSQLSPLNLISNSNLRNETSALSSPSKRNRSQPHIDLFHTAPHVAAIPSASRPLGADINASLNPNNINTDNIIINLNNDNDVAMRDAWDQGGQVDPAPEAGPAKEEAPNGIKEEVQEGPRAKSDPPKRGILHDVVIYVSKALSHKENKILEVATSLGASHRWVFDDFVTHYVHQGRRSHNKDTKTALNSAKVFVVSPQWIYKCKEVGQRVREDLYPCEVDPAKSFLSIEIVRSDSNTQSESQFTKPLPKKKLEPMVRKRASKKDEWPEFKGSPTKFTVSSDLDDDSNPRFGLTQGMLLMSNPNPKPGSNKQKKVAQTDRFGSQSRSDDKRTSSTSQIGGRSQFNGVKAESPRDEDQTLELNYHDLNLAPLPPVQTLLPPILNKNSEPEEDPEEYKDLEKFLKTLSSKTDSLNRSDSNPLPNFPALVSRPTLLPVKSESRLSRAELMGTEITPKPIPISESQQQFEDLKAIGAVVSFQRDGAEDLLRKKILQQLNSPTPVSPQKPSMSPKGKSKADLEKEKEKEKEKQKALEKKPSEKGKDLAKTTPAKPAQISLTQQFKKGAKKSDENPYFFMTSGLGSELVTKLTEQVQALGGKSSSAKEFTQECTHLVVSKPIRSEKYMAACASGCWVLMPSYLEACIKAKKFVDETPFEWSLTNAATALASPSVEGPSTADLTVDAPSIWRKKIVAKKSKGAFDGWKVALFCVDSRQSGLLRVLKAGGAQIVASEVKDLKTLNSRSVEFVFAEKERLKAEPEILKTFKRLELTVLAPEFIADYLIKFGGEKPDQTPYLVPT